MEDRTIAQLERSPADEELDRLVRELREWGRDHPIPVLPEPPVPPSRLLKKLGR